MKNIVNYLLLIPVIYSGFMIHKTPTISDALIVFSFCCMIVFLNFISAKYVKISENTDLSELEEELKTERLKVSLEQLKENALKEKAIRDSRAAVSGYQEGKQIKF